MLQISVKKTLGNFKLNFDGEFKELSTVILGPSGCGKTTLLKMISGLITPDSGVIVLNGKTLFDSNKKINLPPQKREIGYCFQDYALFPNMSVGKNIQISLCHIKDKQERQRFFNEVVQTLGISNILDSYPYKISGGQASRVALARVIVNKAKFFLFDEVFSALDWKSSQEIQSFCTSIIKKYNKQSIFVTHNPLEALNVSTYAYTLNLGSISQQGSTKEIIDEQFKIYSTFF